MQRTPGGIDLWVVDSVNPDGWRAQRRTNARAVDLNRNFNSGNWVYSGAGTGSYSGPSAASEPETRAMQGFLDSVRPRLMVVWHQVGRHVGATAFTVEMPTDFTYRTARVHAMAFLDLAGRA